MVKRAKLRHSLVRGTRLCLDRPEGNEGWMLTHPPPATYPTVTIENGRIVSLAGGPMAMNRAVENLPSLTGASLRTAVRLASRNPAHMLGLEHLTALTFGSPANFNRFSEAGERVGSIFRGRQAAS
jgi:N-acetylglucosamine-6-phosphate deacetylase